MEIDRLKEIVSEASALMARGAFEVKQKGSWANIVTSSDVAVQDFLRNRLAAEMPGSDFICEEGDAHSIGNLDGDVWVIDPIDGTANYARGIAQCAICVGLRSAGKMKMAVVYLPYTGEMFWAEAGKGAWLNEERIHVSDRPFENAIMSTALPVYHKEAAEKCSRIICKAFGQINDIRRFGAAAPELCYLAMGRTELYFEYMLSAWDFAAASLIVEEAGGCLCSTAGMPLDSAAPSGVLAANNPHNLARLLEIVNPSTQG